jgi:hypothetical protein
MSIVTQARLFLVRGDGAILRPRKEIPWMMVMMALNISLSLPIVLSSLIYFWLMQNNPKKDG